MRIRLLVLARVDCTKTLERTSTGFQGLKKSFNQRHVGSKFTQMCKYIGIDSDDCLARISELPWGKHARTIGTLPNITAIWTTVAKRLTLIIMTVDSMPWLHDQFIEPIWD